MEKYRRRNQRDELCYGREEGEPLNALSVGLQKISLPITKQMDKVFKSNKDVGRLEFKRV